MEITPMLNLVTEPASFLSDTVSMLGGNSSSSWDKSYDYVNPERDEAVSSILGGSTTNPDFTQIIENSQLVLREQLRDVQESEEDDILSVVEDLSLPLDSNSDLSLPLDSTSETSLPIAVEIEGTENGQLVAKVITLEERNIRRRLSGDIHALVSKDSEESEEGSAVRASLVAVQLSVENDPSKGGVKSVYELDCVPLWGSVSICGHRPEMEDAVSVEPHFMKIPIEMFIGNQGLSQTLSHLTSHFYGVYDGHGGSRVADYCRDRLHLALVDELKSMEDNMVYGSTIDTREMHWEKVFTRLFLKVDDEVGGKASRAVGSTPNSYTTEPVAAETVGSTAVVAVVCSSHIVVANCGDSRAVLYRGKEVIALSVDHKPSREDEYARIEASGGKVIQWNGHRVFGVLAMSRSIGDRYLKPWIIPEPEVMFMPRARADECVVLASDGLWDVMTNEEACEVARKRILIWHKKNGSTHLVNRGDGVDPAAQAAADYLSMLALQKGSKDNISIIVVDLKAQRKFKNKS